MKSCRRTSLHGPVPVCHCGGMGPGELVPRLFDSAGIAAFGEHPPKERSVTAAKNFAPIRSLIAADRGK